MAGEQRIEFLLRQDDQSCKPFGRGESLRACRGWKRCRLAARGSGRSAASPLRQSSSSSSAFTGPDRGRRQRQCAIAENGERQRADRLRGEFAAQRHRLAVLLRLVGDVLERAQHRRRQRIKALRHARIAAVGGIEELHQVVGADREEIDALQQFVELEQQ